MNISLSAQWIQNASTLAGQANGASGTSINYLKTVEGISISNNDMLYIADAGNNRIVTVQLDGLANNNTIGLGPSPSNSSFNYPSDVIATDTAIYVMDSGYNRVLQWLRNRTNPIMLLGTSLTNNPLFLFVDNDNNLYVSDCNNDKVFRYALNSSSLITVAGNDQAGSTTTQLNCPLGIFVDNNKAVYVADYVNHRIQKWANGASSGQTVAGITGLYGSTLSLLYHPKSVVVDVNGYMYIVDAGNNRILRWALNASSGVCIVACTGTSGNQANQLNGPVSLAFDRYGSIYVSDQSNNRVQKFQIFSSVSEYSIINDEDDTTEDFSRSKYNYNENDSESNNNQNFTHYLENFIDK